ncbi:MAG: hypothetical protein MASP_00807 [Candidatus Methanolliviera sp. GoM_asphalt]|nr:MAG: hypothetical protein MASP_00807 [Candidatus Methanolliviera sp. GoM_asphalt]
MKKLSWVIRYKTETKGGTNMIRKVRLWWKKDVRYPLKFGFISQETGAESEIDMPYFAGERNSMCPGDAQSSGTAGYYLCALAKQAKSLGLNLNSANVRVTRNLGLLTSWGISKAPLLNIQPEIEVDGEKDNAERLMKSVESVFDDIYAVSLNIKQERMDAPFGCEGKLEDNRAVVTSETGKVMEYAFDEEGAMDPRDTLTANAEACYGMIDVVLSRIAGCTISDYDLTYSAEWDAADGREAYKDCTVFEGKITIPNGAKKNFYNMEILNDAICPVSNTYKPAHVERKDVEFEKEHELMEAENSMVPGIDDTRGIVLPVMRGIFRQNYDYLISMIMPTLSKFISSRPLRSATTPRPEMLTTVVTILPKAVTAFAPLISGPNRIQAVKSVLAFMGIR